MYFDFFNINLIIVSGLGLHSDYLSSRTLTDLQQPPSTLASSDFPFSVDGEYARTLGSHDCKIGFLAFDSIL